MNRVLPDCFLATQRTIDDKLICSVGVSMAKAGLPSSLNSGMLTGCVFINISLHYIWRLFLKATRVSRWRPF